MSQTLVAETNTIQVFCSDDGIVVEDLQEGTEHTYWWFEVLTRFARIGGFTVWAFQKPNFSLSPDTTRGLDEFISVCNRMAYLPYHWVKTTGYTKAEKPVNPSAADLTPVAELGRLAYAVTCLEHLASAWSVETEAMRTAIEHLWAAFTYIRQHRLDLWEARFVDVYDIEQELSAYERLTAWQKKLLLLMLEEIPEIICTNLYCAYNPAASIYHTQRTALLLQAARVRQPDFAQFGRVTREQHGDWGRDLTPELFRTT